MGTVLASGIWKPHILPGLSHVLLFSLRRQWHELWVQLSLPVPAWYPGTHLGFIELFSFFVVFCFKQGNPLPNVLLPFLFQFFSVVLSSPFHSTPEWQNPCTPGPSASLGCYFGDLNSPGIVAKGFTEELSRTFSFQYYSRAPFSLCNNKCFPTGPPGTLVMFDSNLWPFLCTGHYNLVSPGINKICSLGYNCPCWEPLLWRMVKRISSSMPCSFIFWNIGRIQSTLFPLAPSITVS